MRSSHARRAVLAVFVGVLLARHAMGQERNVTRNVVVGQSDLLGGRIPLAKVLETGGQCFSAPYLPADGHGEGPAGPRATQRQAFYLNAVDRTRITLPYLRVDGIDSQSCYECHNSIGTRRGPDYESRANLRRESGIIGGSAGIVSTLMQNLEFPTRLTLFLRNPPHVFGVGYTQMLAEEMTHELMAARDEADKEAMKAPGKEQRKALRAKDTDFGEYRVVYDAARGRLEPDYSRVTGVNADLIVRPLQNKGIAGTVRSFVRTALQFHFSIEGVEVAGFNRDGDRDGRFNEMALHLDPVTGVVVDKKTPLADALKVPQIDQSLGSVTALSAFVAMTRPPQQMLPRARDARAAAERGKELFLGRGIPNLPEAAARMCAQCHHPVKRLDKAILSIETQYPLPEPMDPIPPPRLGSAAFNETTRPHPFVSRYRHRNPAPRVPNAPAPAPIPAPAPDYTINLTEPDKAHPKLLPAHIYPRLKPNADGSVDVPLFSDLKLHDMGLYLTDDEPQEVDVQTRFTPQRQFLTRPIWGVGDTQPWLHDGRALTLRDAILMHAYRDEQQAPDCNDGMSEAFPVIKAFRTVLTPAQQDDLVQFLLTLRLPAPGKPSQWAREPKL